MRCRIEGARNRAATARECYRNAGFLDRSSRSLPVAARNEALNVEWALGKMIRIITVEREFGAGGAAIAEKIAERLGWKLWDQALTAEIARLAQVDRASVERLDERCDPLFYRLMKVFIRGSYERSLPV